MIILLLTGIHAGALPSEISEFSERLTNRMQKSVKIIWLVLSVGFFLASLTQKSFCTTRCGDSILTLLTGWMGIAYLDYAALPWLANPAILLAWIFFWKKPLPAIGFSLLSTGLAASFLLLNTIVDNEGDVRRVITKLETGYWLWLSAHISFLIGCAVELLALKLHYRSKNTLK